jgi:PAS domain S-box-containing protein
MSDDPRSSGSPGGDRRTGEPERAAADAGPGEVHERTEESFDLAAWILAATSEAVVAIDRDSRVTFWNPAAEKLYGVSASEAVGRPVGECYGYEFESPEQERQALEALEQRGRWRGDNIHVTRSGRRIPVAATVNRIPEEHGGGYFAMIRNIRLRKSAETELRISQERERARTLELETLMRAAPAVIWISHDPECQVVTGNPASDRLLRQPEGANPSATAPGADRRGWREMRNGVEIPPSELPVQVAARGTEVRDAELSLVFDDGEVRHILGNAAPLRAKDGSVTGSIAAFVDITARKKAEEALQEALRRKDEFLAMLAHELRNPLGAITHALELLRSCLPPGAPGGWERDVVERQVAHLTRIVDDLLDVSRLTRGKIQLKKGPLPLAAAINLAIETSRAEIDARGQQIFVSVPEGIWVDGDSRRARMRSDIVTGPGGVVGHCTAERLLASGFAVVGVDNRRHREFYRV